MRDLIELTGIRHATAKHCKGSYTTDFPPEEDCCHTALVFLLESSSYQKKFDSISANLQKNALLSGTK